MKTKLLIPVILTTAVAIFNTGCLKTHHNGTAEKGTRATLVFGLADYQDDYSLHGNNEAFIFEEKPLESNTYSALRGVTSSSNEWNYELNGKKVSLLWGLIKVKLK